MAHQNHLLLILYLLDGLNQRLVNVLHRQVILRLVNNDGGIARIIT